MSSEYKILKVREIILEMLHDRNYSIIDENEQMIISREDNTQNYMQIFIENSQLNIKRLQYYLNTAEKNKYSHIIIVHNGNVTIAVKNNMSVLPIRIELFGINELQYNITKHILVPKHEKVSNEMKKSLMKYGMNFFPTITTVDPVCRYYDFKRGDIIKITRKNGYVIYRIVVSST